MSGNGGHPPKLLDGGHTMNMLIQGPRRNAWSPLNDDLDTLFEGFFRPLRRSQDLAEPMIPAIDVTERENDYVVRADMPGVNKDNIDITLTDGVLTISAEVKEEHEEKDGERLLRQERRCGKYTRSLQLGTQVDDKKVKANYKDGVLEIVLPKAEEVKPKRIAIG